MDDPLRRLDDLLQQMTLRTNTQLGVEHANLHKLAAAVFALVELMVEKGLFTREELSVHLARTYDRLDDGPFAAQAQIESVSLTDKREQPNSEVDCEARMPLCHGACCSLEVPLSAQDLEEGIVRWDVGRPYYIRHDGDGRCTHQVRATGFCGIYGDRPRECRSYSCKNDRRIWRDFDLRVPNTKAIEALLVHRAQRPVRTEGHDATLPDVVPVQRLRLRR